MIKLQKCAAVERCDADKHDAVEGHSLRFDDKWVDCPALDRMRYRRFSTCDPVAGDNHQDSILIVLATNSVRNRVPWRRTWRHACCPGASRLVLAAGPNVSPPLWSLPAMRQRRCGAEPAPINYPTGGADGMASGHISLNRDYSCNTIV